LPTVPIRWVLVRDPDGQLDSQAFLYTLLDADPVQVLEWFVRCWQVEGTFQETRAHLGMETQRQGSDRAIARTTPTLLAFYSRVTWLAHLLSDQAAPLARTAAWYAKPQPTFSDTIAWVRRHLWANPGFSISTEKRDIVKVPQALYQRLTEALCYAA
jgi:hypothetical protein